MLKKYLFFFVLINFVIVIIYIQLEKNYLRTIQSFLVNIYSHNDKIIIKYKTKKNFFIPTKTCWRDIFDNKNVTIASSPQNALCLFSPLKVKDKQEYEKTIVVLGIGVHQGPLADNKEILPKAGFKYISWKNRDKRFNRLHNYLAHGYSKRHLKLTQEIFWNVYRNDPDLIEADIIVCGFDSWHCLIFAPFNKRIVINSNYRFDGHIRTLDEDMVDLQNELYNAVRYNPDVILAGSTFYDVMYQQHYLGSHKIIPLPASCEYVQSRIEKEVKEDKNCKNKCKNASNKTIVIIFPKRLSKGGKIVAKQIRHEANKKERTFEIKYFAECFPSHYNYCQMGQIDVAILLGYSVMSYFSCEVANVGIPLFVPSAELYAKYEKLHHLVSERKQRLDHSTYDIMKQNIRSLNYGYNPNDDFDDKALQRWLSYSDYYYYKGTETYNNYDILFHKLSNLNLSNMKYNAFKHRIENVNVGINHWHAIGRYFFGDSIFLFKEKYMPKTFGEGLNFWKKQVTRPDFTLKDRKDFDGPPIAVLMLADIHGIIPECFKFKFYKIVLLTDKTKKVNDCQLLDHKVLLEELALDLFNSISFPSSIKWHEIAMVVYGANLRASKVTILKKSDNFSSNCLISNEFEFLENKSLWTMSTYDSTQYWYIFAPEDIRVFSYWIKTLASFTTDLKNIQLTDCRNIFLTRESKFSEKEIGDLSSYLYYWQSDETESFFYIVDQLNFELAVRGYLSQLHAKLSRWWLHKLVKLGYYQPSLPS
ncbi:uncharacterized protein LOC100203850 isoform X1 [Hydra vulgaris]|uniref:uncharacterized protein LOC100203850 isoform X1 n=1 Tax=Hydra vulgaris TaxID=6087 RepID=UPI001F5EF17E|nr:uncharacterized protein LOC100203850 [Hydra vulgaris]